MRSPRPRTNQLRDILAEGRVPIGMQCFSGSHALLEIIGYAGFDYVMLDTEHASVDPSQLESLIRTAENVGLIALVRVEDNDETAIRKALEAGAAGIIVPRVKTAEEMAYAISCVRYPPTGIRGMCPATRASRYSMSGWEEFARWTNEDVEVIPILEHPDSVENVEAICQVPGVHIINFGPGDMGQAMGVGAQGLTNPKIVAALDHVIEVAEAHGKVVMSVPFPDLSQEACKKLIERGITMMLHSIDELLFYGVCREIMTTLEPHLFSEKNKAIAASM